MVLQGFSVLRFKRQSQHLTVTYCVYMEVGQTAVRITDQHFFIPIPRPFPNIRFFSYDKESFDVFLQRLSYAQMRIQQGVHPSLCNDLNPIPELELSEQNSKRKFEAENEFEFKSKIFCGAHVQDKYVTTYKNAQTGREMPCFLVLRVYLSFFNFCRLNLIQKDACFSKV